MNLEIYLYEEINICHTLIYTCGREHFVALQCTILHCSVCTILYCSAMIKWRQTAQAERTQTTTWSRGRLNLHQSILVWFGFSGLITSTPDSIGLVWISCIYQQFGSVCFCLIWFDLDLLHTCQSVLVWSTWTWTSQYWFVWITCIHAKHLQQPLLI